MTNLLILISIVSMGLVLTAETSTPQIYLIILCNISVAAAIAAVVMIRRKHKL